MSKSIYDYVLKFIIVGDSTVGKSNIMMRYTDKRFQISHDMTIGVEFATKIVSIGNTNYKMQIWDTAGQETFMSITRSYYRGTIGCLLVYDTTRRHSFDLLSTWLIELRKYCDLNIVIALVGNKIDLADQREVSYEEGKAFAEKNNLLFYETSAKTSLNVEICFTEIVKCIQKKIENNEIQLFLNSGPIIKIQPLVPTKSGTCRC